MDKKQLIKTIVCAIAILSMLAACAPASTPVPPTAAPAKPTEAAPAATKAPTAAPTAVPQTKEPVTLEWWTVNSEEYSEQAQRDLAKLFESKNPNIKIKVTVLPESGFMEKVNAAFGAGQGAPDLFFMWDTNWYPQAMDLKASIAEDKFDTKMYPEGFWTTRALWGDVVIGLPLGVGANFVMYNKDLFDKKGVAYPKENVTASEWLEILKKVNSSADKKWWAGDRPRAPFRAIWYNFGDQARPFSDDNMKVDGYLNSADSVAAYGWFLDLVNTGATPSQADIQALGTEGTGPVDLFLAGRLASATLNQSHMLAAEKAGIKFGIVAEPGLDGKKQWVNAWSNTVSIWKKTKYPKEAWQFLKFWAGPEGQKFLMEKGNFFPSVTSVLNESPYVKQESGKVFMKILQFNQTQTWRGTHPCESTVLRAAQGVYDKINLNKIKKEEIKAELDAVVPAAQKALDECRARLTK